MSEIRNKDRLGTIVVRPVSARPKLADGGKLLSPKSFIKLNNNSSCLILFWMRWATSGYGALKTKVIFDLDFWTVLDRRAVCGSRR